MLFDFCSDEEDNSWKVTWYVTSRGDVGDFYLIVREVAGNKPLLEKDLVYKERSFKIKDLPESMNIKYELCVLARDSIGNVKHFRSSQCQILNKRPILSSDSSALTCYFTLTLVTITLIAVM